MANFWAPDKNGDFVALLSYLPLKSYWRVPQLLLCTAQVVKQLATADGLLDYSVLPIRCPSGSGRSLVWRDGDALRAFVHHPPHVRVMAGLAPYMDRRSSCSGWSRGSQLPLRWDDAFGRFSGSPPSTTKLTF